MFKYGAASSSSFEGRIWALTTGTMLPNTFRLGVSAVNSTAPSAVNGVDLALNTDYQVVLLWDPVTDDALSLWVNPISSSDTKAESNDSYTPYASTTNNIADDFAFRQATGFGGFFTVSNLVIATTFNEASTNVLATNAVAPGLFINQQQSPATLSGLGILPVGSGQWPGLGNLTYQWQVSATADNANPVRRYGQSPAAPFDGL